MAAKPRDPNSKKRFQGRLTEDQRIFITVRMAMWVPPIEIIAEFKEMWPGIELRHQNCQKYDPNKSGGRGLSAKLRAVFAEARERFKKDCSDVAILQKKWRAERLQALADNELAKDRRNPKLIMELLERGAKEEGNAYSNQRRLEHTGAGGGAIKIEGGGVSGLLAAAMADDDDGSDKSGS